MSGFVYFVRMVDRVGPIKIGYSWHPEERLKALAVWSPYELEIAAVANGEPVLEAQVHNHFFDLHLHHEWFEPQQRLLDAIEALRAGVDIEDAIDLTEARGNLRKKQYGRSGFASHPRTKGAVTPKDWPTPARKKPAKVSAEAVAS